MITSVRLQTLEMVLLAATHLEPLLDSLVFVGGATTGFLITDRAAPDVRPTIDVDVLVEVTSLADYHRLEDRLRELGLKQEIAADGPICRWKAGSLNLDVMPTDERILGFSNRWYRDAASRARSIEIAESRTIRCITAPYFLATKLEAFKGRGGGDVYASHDLEDVIALVDGRSELADELDAGDGELRRYVATEISALLADEDFRDALAGRLVRGAEGGDRVSIVLERLGRLAAL